MTANSKRFTISVTESMEKELEAVKQEVYSGTSQDEMIRVLIRRGLASLKEGGDTKERKRRESA